MMTCALVRTYAQYNTWQNKQLMDIIEVMDQAELDKDRGAFFGSIQGTLSHLLWGDQIWMSRFDAESLSPKIPGTQSATAFLTKSDWLVERTRCDARMRVWAAALQESDLTGDFTWINSFEQTQVTKPIGRVIAHFFNHQTHHRGQVHAMLTAAGQSAPVSDLSYMPEDA